VLQHWRRVAFEVALILLGAAVATVTQPGWKWIIVIMACAYAGVLAIEWTASRQARAKAAPGKVAEQEPVFELRPEHLRVHVLPRNGLPKPPPESQPVPAGPGPEPLPAAVQVPVPPEPPLEEPKPLPEPEPELAPPPARPLTVAPPLPPEPAAEPAREPAVAVSSHASVAVLSPRGPREWNLWDLERLARQHSGTDVFRDEERSYLLMYLREFASTDGVLPADFDTLVRDSFGDLVGTG
jgi:hypothetical protein